MTSRARASGAGTAAAAAALLCFLSGPAARAESRSEEDMTPLSLVAGADVVAVVRGERPSPGAPAAEGVLGRLRILEVLRGAAVAEEVLPVEGREDLNDLRVVPGVRSVAFLQRLPGKRWQVLGDARGLLALEESPPGGAEAPALSLLRILVEEARPGGGLAAPGRVRAALVDAATGGDPRFRAGAALDLLRVPGLLARATEVERAALLEAFRTAENRFRVKFHLARMVGHLSPEGGARLLADALLAPEGFAIRPAVGLALADLGDPEAVALLASRAATASAEARALIAGALGWSGLAAARGPLEALLGAAEPPVRSEAAVALGRLRTAEAAPALLSRFLGEPGGAASEGDAGVRRALAWALAQCDAPEAWRALEAAAAAEGRESESFRGFVRGVLENPRRSFVR